MTTRRRPAGVPRADDAKDFARRSELVVPADLDGAALDRAVRQLVGGSWASARRLVTSGKVRLDGRVVTEGTQPVAAGARIGLDMAAPSPRVRELRELDAELFVHVDAAVAVVRKPAGISTVPYPATARPGVDAGSAATVVVLRSDEVTLDDLVRRALERRDRLGKRAPLGVVQRLDKETSGLIVFARTLAAKRALEQQLRDHSMHRRYLAIAHGTVARATYRTSIASNRGDGLRGSVRVGGQEAVTHVEPLERLAGATLVACRLETGRTHQIRIHLSEAGHPIVGEPVYVRGYRGRLLEAPRLMLHAVELGFVHPTTGETLRFEDRPPRDFVRVLGRLRGRGGGAGGDVSDRRAAR
ncbi:MAG: RluA family pseudouridine synthase [Myxococcales bacterium]|nr:RluA family pseudouridine synthase [Myxococcales bacterium]